MRGSLYHSLYSLFTKGIIPAHAGLTSLTVIPSPHLRDHPRACGAHYKSVCFIPYILGSSPRMRGSLILPVDCVGRGGIIPAHAGLTSSHTRAGSSLRDHPRACGAHIRNNNATNCELGSSPRMRGSPPTVCKLQSGTGIIPAHAGLTQHRMGRIQGPRDHPRACGAHNAKVNHNLRYPGSSPRMRGSQEGFTLSDFKKGIIPAHAGLTGANSPSDLSSRDHPRACGAHHWYLSMKKPPRGSSPRMRGSQEPVIGIGHGCGIIPAHAGLTLTHSAVGRLSWDHPRACGAHIASSMRFLRLLGSSPRMRGSHRRAPCVGSRDGIIPAHAGLTVESP